MNKDEWIITNLKTGKTMTLSEYFKQLGRKSAKVRNAGKSKEQISAHYRKLRTGK